MGACSLQYVTTEEHRELYKIPYMVIMGVVKHWELYSYNIWLRSEYIHVQNSIYGNNGCGQIFGAIYVAIVEIWELRSRSHIIKWAWSSVRSC